jgi:hypothetical protein
VEGGLVAAMARAYRDPRGAMARQVGEGLSEPRALFHLLLAGALFFVASLPNAIREARHLGIDDAISGAVAAHLFGYGFVAPLLAYAAAAVLHLAARAFGGRGGFLGARAALFWAALLGAPIALALALAGVGAELTAASERLPWLTLMGYAGLGFWLWLFAASFAEAEGFAGTRRAAIAVGVGFAGLAALLAVLSGRLAVAG